MKKNVILLFAAALLTAVLILQTSCNLTAPEYGVLTLDFENGAARSIGANGLPNLSDSTMQIDITGNSIVPITKRLEKDEPKVFSQILPVGETVHIKVSIITPSATWAGFTGLTVESGDNEVAVKLNKVIASMRPVLFSAIQSDPTNPYTFKLNMSGTPLEITQPGPNTPSNSFFCTRDGKGRLYAAYHDGFNGFEIQRYTSEGSSDKQVDLTNIGSAVDVKGLTTDLKTGKVYVTEGGNIYEIKDDAAPPHTPKAVLLTDSGDPCVEVGVDVLDDTCYFLSVITTEVADDQVVLLVDEAVVSHLLRQVVLVELADTYDPLLSVHAILRGEEAWGDGQQLLLDLQVIGLCAVLLVELFEALDLTDSSLTHLE